MNKNESTTAPGWYYYSTDDVNFPEPSYEVQVKIVRRI